MLQSLGTFKWQKDFESVEENIPQLSYIDNKLPLPRLILHTHSCQHQHILLTPLREKTNAVQIKAMSLYTDDKWTFKCMTIRRIWQTV